MAPIEQAIYASRRTDHATGYHLVVASEGVTDDDAHALSVWGPSHDSLVEASDEAESINFHPLPSGSYCISRTRRTGTEYSGRGDEVYTHCLVVPVEVLARFSNNPFALVRAVIADGRIEIREHTPRCLPGFALRGKASPVDRHLLEELVSELGREKMSSLIDESLQYDPLAIVTTRDARRLMEGLLNCLPLGHRPSFSFATGLKPSPRRPFRVQCLPKELKNLRQVLRHFESAVSDMASPQKPAGDGGWGHVVTSAIVEKRCYMLSEELRRSCDKHAEAHLQELTARLRQRLNETGDTRSDDQQENSFRKRRQGVSRVERCRSDSRRTRKRLEPSRPMLRGDAPHIASTTRAEPAASVDEDIYADPAQQLGQDRPELIEQLELLDDTVFEAIAGKPSALERLKTLWPQTLSALGMRNLEESREQYLRHARAVWDECAISDGVRNSEQSLAALSVISLLLDDCPK